MVKCPSNLDHVRPNSLPTGHQGRSKSLPSGHHVRSKSLPWGHHVRPIPYPGDRPQDQIPSRRIKQHRQLQRKGHIKIELCVRLSALRLVDVSHVHKIAKVSCRLILPQMVFVSAAKNGRFTVAGSRYRQNLTYENFTALFGRLRQKLHQIVCRTCRTPSTIIFPHSTNQIIDLWRCRCRSRRHSLINFLLIDTLMKENYILPLMVSY